MKSKKTNPLKFFNDNKAMAKAKAMKEMKKFKKSLPKAQDGIAAGPFEKGTTEYLDARFPGTALKFQGPYSSKYMASERDKVANVENVPFAPTSSLSELEAANRRAEERRLRQPENLNYPTGLTADDADYYRKGGSVKKKTKKYDNGGTVRNVERNKYGSLGEVDRTKKDGSSKYKVVEANTDGTGTVRKYKYNSKGEEKKYKVRNISAKKADRKIKRIEKKVNR